MRSRIEMAIAIRVETPTNVLLEGEPKKPALPFRVLVPEEVRAYRNCVPLLDLKVAAGRFSEEQGLDESLPGDSSQERGSNTWIALPDAFRPRKGLFVAQVVGESINRRIPNGAWCLFSVKSAGSRQGKVVLAAHREIADSEFGGHYTVKVYESSKLSNPDGTWQHSSIRLKPDSSLPGYEPVDLKDEQADELRILAELVAVLS